MKNQLLNLKMIALMCLMMVLGGANVWAESKTYSYEFKSGDFSVSKLSAKLNEVTWTLKASSWKGKEGYSFDMQNGRGFKIGPNSDKYPKYATLSTSEIDGTITSIVINTSGNSDTKAKLDVLVGGKAFGKQQALTSEAKNLSFAGSASGQIELKYSNSNTPIYVKSISVTYEAAPTYTSATMTFVAKDSEGYYATFSSDKVTFFPTDQVIPYAITVANGKITDESNMFKSEDVSTGSETINGYYIPANTGIMLYSTAKDVNYYTVENYTVDALAEGVNMLMPAPVAGGIFTEETGNKYYKLAYDNYDAKTGLGFYWGADNGGAFNVKAGTAYLAVPEAIAAGAKGFTLNGEATGIEGINANVENAKAIYNLNGQRVATMAKPGLYIVNGKKIVRK